MSTSIPQDLLTPLNIFKEFPLINLNHLDVARFNTPIIDNIDFQH